MQKDKHFKKIDFAIKKLSWKSWKRLFLAGILLTVNLSIRWRISVFWHRTGLDIASRVVGWNNFGLKITAITMTIVASGRRRPRRQHSGGKSRRWRHWRFAILKSNWKGYKNQNKTKKWVQKRRMNSKFGWRNLKCFWKSCFDIGVLPSSNGESNQIMAERNSKETFWNPPLICQQEMELNQLCKAKNAENDWKFKAEKMAKQAEYQFTRAKILINIKYNLSKKCRKNKDSKL